MAGQVEFRDNTDEVLEALAKAKHRGLEAIGMTAERHAKKKCPVDTGRLRNSITYAISGYSTHVKSYRRANVVGGATKKQKRYEYSGEIMEGKKDEAIYIGSNVEYAPFVELGFKGRPPVHFLQDAASNHGEEYKRLMEESMKNA
jgi:hypothetical protein